MFIVVACQPFVKFLDYANRARWWSLKKRTMFKENFQHGGVGILGVQEAKYFRCSRNDTYSSSSYPKTLAT